MEGNSRGGGSFPVLRDPHLENSEGEADAAIRLVRLHGVAGGEQEGQRLPDGGVEDHKRRGKFQRHGGSIPAFVGRLLHQAGGTSRAIFRAASRRAVNRDMAVGSIIFTANTLPSVNNSTPDYRRCSGKCRVKRELSADRIGAMRKRKKPTASKGSSTRESGAQNGRKLPADAMFI